MGKIYTIISGKGGVGKTTSAINLAAALNSLQEEAIVVDGNLITPNVGLHFGAPIVPVSLNHVLNGKAVIHEAIYEHESGTKVIPASLSLKDLKKTNPEKLKNAVKLLKKTSDHIILDSAAGLGEEALAAIDAGDEIIIITNPEMPAVTDALKTIKIAEERKKPVTGVIITRIKRDGYDMPYLNVKGMLEVPILGIIPEDKNMRKALVMKNAVYHTHPNSKSSRAYREIAEKLSGKKYDSINKPSLYEQVLKKIGLR
ncbi:MAG: cell division ATPase MinD [archaeon]